MAPVKLKKMDRQVTVRCDEDDARLLVELQAQLPALSLAAVAREAMRRGLALLDGDASKLVTPRKAKP